MSPEDQARFYKAMASYRQSRQEAAEQEAKMLWDHVIALVNAISEMPADCADHAVLKEDGHRRAVELAKYLEHLGARR